VKIKAEIDLDEIMAGGDWDTSIGEMVRDELKSVIKAEIRSAIRSNDKLKKAIKALESRAADQILAVFK